MHMYIYNCSKYPSILAALVKAAGMRLLMNNS